MHMPMPIRASSGDSAQDVDHQSHLTRLHDTPPRLVQWQQRMTHDTLSAHATCVLVFGSFARVAKCGHLAFARCHGTPLWATR